MGPPWEAVVGPVGQQFPTFLAPGTGFVEDSFSTDRGRGCGFGMIQARTGEGDGFEMIQVRYIYGALYFYYDYIVIYNEIIIQLTIM